MFFQSSVRTSDVLENLIILSLSSTDLFAFRQLLILSYASVI